MANYKSLGVTVSRVMTDNSCYRPNVCRDNGLKRVRIKPYTPPGDVNEHIEAVVYLTQIVRRQSKTQ
jgi:hypothetical protein